MELLAIFHGLNLAWDHGFRQVECRSDCLEVLKLVQGEQNFFHAYATTIASIRDLLSRDWSVVLRHTLREGNQCADILAKKGSAMNSGLTVFDVPSPDLMLALLADYLGIMFPRL
ncbi:hypothetical protein RIF29_26901 [Crotalaria pallida]|uniref:RNase H type-1 domain-containing protein n=1 Tax=Crotalaria pallida TaxID=3830 RepID=A0AAN9EQF5_CROPI